MSSVKKHREKEKYKKYLNDKQLRNKAMETLEKHFGSDFWELVEANQVDHIVNAMIEFKSK